ncbi:hypothetical protein KP79_PYT24444 [Mizuhopecten yessoensis]|uniref:Uncharacterized protein n=1 Tax=Mizuhopecten yessoensis TaxID=6573 RepID=A0A210PHR7_MIZYE|nr:hypothetical protein KP79_PYT24444 [Mizuhopecten yessoensis]
MLNMVQRFAAKDRIPSENSFDEPSAEDIRDIPLYVYVPKAQEEDELRSELSVMVCRIMCRHIKCFKAVVVDESIPHRYSRESAWKSDIVGLS